MCDQMPKESEFRTAATDSRGHSEPMQVRVPGSLKAEIIGLVNSRLFPWPTVADFERMAYIMLLRQAKKWKPFQSYLGQLEAMNLVMNREEEQRAFGHVFERMSELISNNLSSGMRSQAVLTVGELYHHIDGMPEGLWKSKYKKELLSRWGSLLDESRVGVDWKVEEGE